MLFNSGSFSVQVVDFFKFFKYTVFSKQISRSIYIDLLKDKGSTGHMQKKYIAAAVILCLAICIVNWSGIGYRPSSSAISDLKAELASLYGEEYTGKEVENGTEDMEFVVKPKTFFFTNWNLRNALCIDYEYECTVIFTNYIEGEQSKVRTVTYQGLDPMGTERARDRAYLNISSKVEAEAFA